MTRISIPVTTDERDALLVNAEKNCRHPRDQARYLLRLALGLADPQNDKTAVETWAGDGGFAESCQPM